MKNKRVLFETITVIAITLLGMLLIPPAKTLFALLPIAYLLIERRLRQRTWGELGFNARTFFADLRANWVLFVLLGFVIQPLTVLWAKVCYIMLRLENKPVDTENIRQYQAESLGRFGGQTLLVELMPIPKHNIGAWGYEELIPQFKSREDYYRQVKPRRLAYLQTLLQENKPRMVIGYGKAYWADYKALFPAMHFARQGQFEVGKSDGQTVILTDHFTARSMNGKLDEVVGILKG